MSAGNHALNVDLIPDDATITIIYHTISLDRIERDLRVGNPFAVHVQLRYFISPVKDHINSGIISPTNGPILIDAAMT